MVLGAGDSPGPNVYRRRARRGCWRAFGRIRSSMINVGFSTLEEDGDQNEAASDHNSQPHSSQGATSAAASGNDQIAEPSLHPPDTMTLFVFGKFLGLFSVSSEENCQPLTDCVNLVQHIFRINTFAAMCHWR